MAIAALLTIAFVSSCKEEEDDPVVYTDEVNGLWASSGSGIMTQSQTMMLMEISGTTASIRTYSLGAQLSSMTNKKEYVATVTYDSTKGKGNITVAGDPDMSFEFGLSNGSDKMFLWNEGKRVHLSHYATTMNEMADALLKSLTPKVQLLSGFDGPSEYHELTAKAPSFATTLGTNVPAPAAEGVLDWIAKGLVTGSASAIAGVIIRGLLEDEEATTLDDILGEVNVVNAQLAELINLVHNTIYEKYLNERTNAYLNPMRNLSNEYILRVKEAWQKDSASVGPIVIEWANRTVGGNPAYVEVQNFIGYLTTTVVEQKNLYQMYDMYVYNTHAWEGSGYEVRENLRAGDLAVIGQSLFLTRLYYAFGDFSDATRESLCKELQETFDRYVTFYKNNEVEHHDDMAICQIKNAHFIMSRQLVARDYQNHPWIPYYTPWEFENQESAWLLVNGDVKYNCAQIYQSCMKEEEAKTIASYYKGTSFTNILDVLVKDAACTLPYSESQMSGKKIMLQLQTDGSDPHQKDNNYYINANKAIEASKDFAIGEKTIGIAWLERHGFLWLEQWFRQWDTYYDNQLWLRTAIDSRY